MTSLHIAMANHANMMATKGGVPSSSAVDQTALLEHFDSIQVKHDTFAATTRSTAASV